MSIEDVTVARELIVLFSVFRGSAPHRRPTSTFSDSPRPSLEFSQEANGANMVGVINWTYSPGTL